MDDKKSVLIELWRLVTMAFACTTLAMSVIGYVVGDVAAGTSAMFSLGSAGLSNKTIFQIFIFALINSGTTLLVGWTFKNLMLLWKLIITMFACLLVSGVMVVLFSWIPPDSGASWLWFVTSFVGLFIITAAGMIIKTNLADRQYERLLTDYKAKQEKEK